MDCQPYAWLGTDNASGPCPRRKYLVDATQAKRLFPPLLRPKEVEGGGVQTLCDPLSRGGGASPDTLSISNFRAKKTPEHKDFTKNPLPESTFFRGLQPLKFFVFGLFFSL